MAQRAHINQLMSDVKQLEEGARRLAGGSLQQAPAGERVRSFRGTGNRQYLAGIQLKGKHILVLVDRSASMMHEELDAILKLRNQPPALRRAAPKWQHALDIADWLSTQFPSGSRRQRGALAGSGRSACAGAGDRCAAQPDA
jgi:hypothetical protein